VTTSPDDQQELEKEIEQTRERLGETVEALAAKVDVKAQAQEKLGQLTARLKGKATRQLRLQDKANQAKRQATQAGQQLRKRPVPAAAAVGVLGALVLFFTLIRRWTRRDK
jgi:chromosome segregation ATPase